MGIKIIVPAAEEQITLELARAHLRIDVNNDSPPTSADDYWLTNIGIPGARARCERWLGRALAPQVVELGVDAFATPLPLLIAPVRSIVSVTYVDSAGDEQTLAGTEYLLDDYAEPGLLQPVSSWPTTKTIDNAVKIRMNVGYTIAGDSPDDYPLPPDLLTAMLLELSYLHENRGDISVEPSSAVKSFLIGHQVRMSMA